VEDNGEDVEEQDEQNGDVAKLRNRDSDGGDDCTKLLCGANDAQDADLKEQGGRGGVTRIGWALPDIVYF